MKLLLIIDICTFFLTVISAAVVRKSIAVRPGKPREPFTESMREGWNVVRSNQGVLALVMISSAITLFMGMFQILAEPLILAFQDAQTLGAAETVCACGMLVSGLILGVRGIRGNHVRMLGISLAAAGLCMTGFGLMENMIPICIFGFGFFAALPFANGCLDTLVRTSIAGEVQGRAWGIIGFLSQIGYAVAYAVSGLAADRLGQSTGLGVGRGSAAVVMIAGTCMVLAAVLCSLSPSLRRLEKGDSPHA